VFREAAELMMVLGVLGRAAPPRTVVAGGSVGERWAVRAGFDGAGRVSTVVTRARGGVSVASRVPHSSLRAGQLVSLWLGRDPAFLLLRALPEATFGTAVLASGDRRHVTLSPVIEEAGLRFGATPLPDEDPLVSVEVVSPLRGKQLIELWQPPARGCG
jgi:hypothetical protein